MATVNKPMDPAKRDDDVNRKLQLYGIAAAFKQGKAPSNKQIDVALNSFLASKAIASPSPRLSDEGRTLVSDVADVVRQAQRLVLTKNAGNLLQDFIWQTQHFDPHTIATPNAPISKDAAKDHGKDALQGLRTLGTLLITNGQFRKLLNDAVVLLRDMAGDAASTAASRVKPPEDALAQIDHPAEDNVWHDSPDLSRGNMKKQLGKGLKKNSPDSVDDASAGAVSDTIVDGASAGMSGAADHRNNGSTSATGMASAAFNSANREAQNKGTQDTSGSVANESASAAKERMRAAKERARDYLSRKMPTERREQTVWRLKKMVLECQQHPDYQQAIETLLTLAEQYGQHMSTVGKQSAGSAQQTRSALDVAETDLKTIIERFANGTSSDELWASIRALYEAAEQDPELKDWFCNVNTYVRRCLQESGYILDDSSTQDWHGLYQRGSYLLRQRYRSHTDRIVAEARFFGEQFDHDAQNKAFAQSMRRLFFHLGNDANGRPTFKPHLVKDLFDVILPAAFERVAYIPVPRIEYSDAQFDAVVENLVIESDNFMPNVLEIATDNFVRWGRKQQKERAALANAVSTAATGSASSRFHHSVTIKVSGIQMDLRNVSYYVRRKQGFPSITDRGMANIMLAGDGFCFKIKMSSADTNMRYHFFKVDKVDVELNHLKIKLLQSNHKLLFNLVKPLLLGLMKPILQRTAEKAIRQYAAQADNQLWHIKEEADRALEEARAEAERGEDIDSGMEGSTINNMANKAPLPNFYRRYFSAIQKQMLQGKQRKEEEARQKAAQSHETAAEMAKRVNVAMTTEDSMFPNIKLPGGISTKATEYVDLARKGNKWESPVFSIGTGPASSNIPAPPQIVRRSAKSASASASPTSPDFGTHHANGGHYGTHSNGSTYPAGVQPGNPSAPMTADAKAAGLFTTTMPQQVTRM